MRLQLTRLWGRAARGIAFGAALAFVSGPTLVPGSAVASDGPFDAYAGSWSGAGTIVSSGQSERIRCRARYEVSPGGMSLHQDLRCASDCCRFDVFSNVVYENGEIAGTWTEKNRNASGSVSGTVNGPELRINVQGTGFTAAISLVTRGNRQSVSIRPTGSDVTLVSIEMRRT